MQDGYDDIEAEIHDFLQGELGEDDNDIGAATPYSASANTPYIGDASPHTPQLANAAGKRGKATMAEVLELSIQALRV